MTRIFVLFLTVAAGCQSPPDDSCAKCVAFTGGLVFDGATAKKRTVIVEGQSIVKILDGEAHLRSGTIVRTEGQTLLPGLFDLHVHTPAPPGPYGFFPEHDGLLDHVKPMLRNGVTHFLDLGSSQSLIFGLRQRIADGKLLGPSMLAAGPLLTPTGGHPCYAGEPPGDACLFVDTPADVPGALAKLMPGNPDVIKVVLEAGTALRPLPRMTNDTLAEVIRRAQGKPVFAHISRRQDLLDGLDAGIRVFAHIPMDDLLSDDDCGRLKLADATIIPTLAVADALARLSAGTLDELNDPTLAEDVSPEIIAALGDPTKLGILRTASYRSFAQSLRDNAIANVRRCAAAGVRIAAGTDAGNPATFHGRSMARELALYVEAGISARDALVAATANAADLMGVDGGRIAVGAPADLLLVEGNPLEDIRAIAHISRVYKNGEAVDRAALAQGGGGSLERTVVSGGDGDLCLAADECNCAVDGVCGGACSTPSDCPRGNLCYPSLSGGGACHAGDGCDPIAQNCSNGAACVFWGNGATSCWIAGSGTLGSACDGAALNCARGFQCDWNSGRCVRLCDPKNSDCNCVDRSAEAGIPVGECA
jgi:imidazolonepropionase-like amidohydrolase